MYEAFTAKDKHNSKNNKAFLKFPLFKFNGIIDEFK